MFQKSVLLYKLLSVHKLFFQYLKSYFYILVLKPVEPTIPSPMQADFEGNSLSQSDASDFSDLPISDFNRSKNNLIDEDEVSNKLLNNDKNKNNADISIGPADSKWDSDDSEMESSSMHQNDLTDSGFKINNEMNLLHKDVIMEKIDNAANNSEVNSIFEDNEDSSWDSEQSEAIQSQSNEQGTKFKSKLSGDEDISNEHKEVFVFKIFIQSLYIHYVLKLYEKLLLNSLKLL